MKLPVKLLYPLLFVLVGVLAAFFLLRQVQKPLLGDEPRVAEAAASLLVDARPVGHVGSHVGNLFRAPTLYPALVAAAIGPLGATPAAARLPGLLLFALTAVLLAFAARRATGGRWGPLLAVGLYALHPLAVQSAVWVNADAAVLPLVALLFVLGVARRDAQPGRWSWLGLGLALGVGLLVNLVTPWLLLGALALYYAAAGRWRRLPGLAAVAVVGAAVFFALYLIPYATLAHLKPVPPVVLAVMRVVGPGPFALVFLAGRATRTVLWLGLPLTAAALLVLVPGVARRFRGLHPAVAYSLVAALVLTVFYVLRGAPDAAFATDFSVVPPLLALALAVALGPELARESRPMVVVLAAVGFVFSFVVVRDPLYWPAVAPIATEVLLTPPTDITKALVLTGVFVVVPVVAFAAITRPRGWALALVILAAAAGPALDVWQGGADYSCRSHYGERGFNAAARLVGRAAPGKRVMVPSDLAYADGYRHPFLESDEILVSRAKFRSLLRDDRNVVVVLRDSDYLKRRYRAALGDPLALQYLNGYYKMQRRGSFVVATRKAFGRLPGAPPTP